MKKLIVNLMGDKIYLADVEQSDKRSGLFEITDKEDFTEQAISAVFEWFMANYRLNMPTDSYEVRYKNYPYVLRMVRDEGERYE